MWACTLGALYHPFHMNTCTFKYDPSLNLVSLLFLSFLYIVSLTVVSRSRIILCYMFSNYMLPSPCLMFAAMARSLITEAWPLSLHIPKSLGRSGKLWSGSSLCSYWHSGAAVAPSGNCRGSGLGSMGSPVLTPSIGGWFLCCSEGSAKAGKEDELSELPLPCSQENQEGFIMPK